MNTKIIALSGLDEHTVNIAHLKLVLLGLECVVLAFQVGHLVGVCS